MLVAKVTHLKPWNRNIWPAKLKATNFLVALLLLAHQAQADKRAKPFPAEKVVATWIGVSEDESVLVRLTLSEGGVGRGAYLFLDEAPRTFPIVSWRYDEGRIRIQPSAPDGPPSWVGPPMHGEILNQTMILEAIGKDWRIKIFLRREAELLLKLQRLADEMEEPAPPIPPSGIEDRDE